jgi:2Fe-2S ferredoxin
VARLVFRQPDGDARTVIARTGLTLMEAAVREAIDGIEAECGGACACATCHVYVADEWIEAVGPANRIEDEMLEGVPERRRGSRLSCQIKLHEQLDGLTVEIPETQG